MRITRDKEIEMGKSKGKQCLRNQQKRSEPSQVCFAELISPNEVEVGLQGYEGQDKEFLRGKWLLNGSVRHRVKIS